MNNITDLAPIKQPEWFGQPRGLTILFLTEMWDQFSFYGMRALLVLYMTKHLMIAQQKASWIYGIYAALVYLTPIFGGIITDRWLGKRDLHSLFLQIATFSSAPPYLQAPLRQRRRPMRCRCENGGC